MRTPLRPLALVVLVLLSACSETPAPPKPVITGEVAIEAWPLPAMPGSAQPDLALAPDGRVLLSWINSGGGRRPAFQFAEFYPDGHWEGPRTVAIGNSMFTNWADTPHIAATADRALWAHWLQKSSGASNAYDIMLVRSLDHGMNWSAPRKAHDDSTQTEHGFVSMWPQTESSIGMAWLDGRNTFDTGALKDGGGHEGHGDGHGGGAMTLRAAVFDANLRASAAAEIDTMACDCCQTDAAATGDGAVLVYRGRSKDEIRDIYATRFDGFIYLTDTGTFTPPEPGEDPLPIRQWSQADAKFRGIEAEVTAHLLDNDTGKLALRAFGDHVRGELDSGAAVGDRDLPRIAPSRFGLDLNWNADRWRAALGATRVMRQDDVAADETGTAGYTLVDAHFAWHWDTENQGWEVFVDANNLTDADARVHTSFLKDNVVLPGRNFAVGVRLFF